MRIAFFISDHGFGHIMRNLPVIKEIAERGHEPVVICADRQLEIAKKYLEDAAVTYIPCHTDAGIIVKPGTLIMDKEKTAKAVDAYVREFPKRIRFAKNLLKEHKIQRVVADIVPWALPAAAEAGVSSYLMASFTWLEQYEGFVPEKHLAVLKTAFQSADHVLYYDLANPPTKKLLGNGTEIGFVARTFSEEAEKIRLAHKRKLVFLSLGASNSGLDVEIDVSTLPYDFITTSSLNLTGENVQRLDASVFHTHDYIKAADYCIAKAGWSTVSEMMLAGVRFAVLKRPDVPEDTMIIEELERRHAAFGIDVEELKNMAAVLRQLESYEKSTRTYENGYRKAADLILMQKAER
jgi:spore coat polysaccharide biosynthesis predicted glycosyltransferase SpsG